jgi:hypothetical protein
VAGHLRLVASDTINPQWMIQVEPDNTSEVEVVFVPEGPGRTRVELDGRTHGW